VAERVTDTTGGYRRSVLRGTVGKLAGRWPLAVLAAATIVISLIVQGFTLEPRWPASPGSGPAVPGPGQ
jgi:hypothetical protein